MYKSEIVCNQPTAEFNHLLALSPQLWKPVLEKLLSDDNNTRQK